MATIKFGGKAVANLDWFGHCEFNFTERTFEAQMLLDDAISNMCHPGAPERIMSRSVGFSAEAGDKLTMCIKIEPMDGFGYYDIDFIMDRLGQEGLEPSESEFYEEGSMNHSILIYSREDIRRPDRYLKSLAHKLSCEIEWGRSCKSAQEIDTDHGLSLEEEQKIFGKSPRSES